MICKEQNDEDSNFKKKIFLFNKMTKKVKKVKGGIRQFNRNEDIPGIVEQINNQITTLDMAIEQTYMENFNDGKNIRNNEEKINNILKVLRSGELKDEKEKKENTTNFLKFSKNKKSLIELYTKSEKKLLKLEKIKSDLIEKVIPILVDLL